MKTVALPNRSLGKANQCYSVLIAMGEIDGDPSSRW